MTATADGDSRAAGPASVRPSASPGGGSDLLARLAAMPPGDPGRRAVREAAIEAWQPMARHLAYRFSGRGESVEDLIQIATIGLIKAIDRFDASLGTDFAAYAVPTVVGEIKRHFRDRTWDIRVPRRLQELKLDITAATDALTQQLRRSPTVADLAAHLQRDEEEILEALESAGAYSALSLQSLVRAGEGHTEVGDLVGQDDPALELAELRVALGPAMQSLTPREQRILTLRFYGNMTQSQIAERIGISQMHVSRLLARALTVLRDQLSQDSGGRHGTTS